MTVFKVFFKPRTVLCGGQNSVFSLTLSMKCLIVNKRFISLEIFWIVLDTREPKRIVSTPLLQKIQSHGIQNFFKIKISINFSDPYFEKQVSNGPGGSDHLAKKLWKWVLASSPAGSMTPRSLNFDFFNCFIVWSFGWLSTRSRTKPYGLSVNWTEPKQRFPRKNVMKFGCEM